jgi:hypothetical protein
LKNREREQRVKREREQTERERERLRRERESDRSRRQPQTIERIEVVVQAEMNEIEQLFVKTKQRKSNNQVLKGLKSPP